MLLPPRQTSDSKPLSNLCHTREPKLNCTMEREGTTVKAFLQKPGTFHVEIRRFPLPTQIGESQSLFELLLAQIKMSFPGLADLTADPTLTWKDPDGDFILMSTDEELRDALSEAQNRQLNIYITVEQAVQGDDYEPFTVLNQHGREDAEAETDMEGPETQDKQQRQTTVTTDNTEQQTGRGDASEQPTSAGNLPPPPPPPMYPHLPPPPPPPSMPWQLMFGSGPWMGRGRPCQFPGPVRRHKGHGLHGNHPHQYSRCFPWANPEWQGYPFHPMMGGEFAHAERHNGNWMPSPRCIRRHGWQNRMSDVQCQPSAAYYGSECRGRGNLMSQVPFKQRRWAKTFIKQWCQKHLKESASSEVTENNSNENQEDHMITMEEAQVSQAYVDWLNKILPKFYKLEGETCVQSLTDEKSTVPMAFQKWCLWFLTWKKNVGTNTRRSCGVRVSFRDPSSPGWGSIEMCKGKSKKEWKAVRKNIKVAVPLKYRVWAKSYIRQWRRDHMISGTDSDFTSSSSSSSSSESEDPEKTLLEVVDIPEDYCKWMDKFLTHWHTRMGFNIQSGTDSNNGSFGLFKDTVPEEFRKWVRCVVNRHSKKIVKRNKRHHHHKCGKKEKAVNHRMYKKWMRRFERKWMEDAGLNAWVSGSSSSSSSSDEDDEKHIATSLKRMRIDPQGSAGTKSQKPYGAGAESVTPDPNVESSDPLLAGGMEEGPQEVSPRAQYTMMKMMSKMHAKQMKLVRKAAKRDMKAAWRAYKTHY